MSNNKNEVKTPEARKSKEERQLDLELFKGFVIAILLALFTIGTAYVLFFKPTN